MRAFLLAKVFYMSLILALLLGFAPTTITTARSGSEIEEAARVLPDRIGDFRAQGAATNVTSPKIFEPLSADDFGVISAAARTYQSSSGEKFTVALIKTRLDSGAYALLTSARDKEIKSVSSPDTLSDTGTLGFVSPSSVIFFKGPTFVSVKGLSNSLTGADDRLTLARQIANALDAGEGEIPVLVKHLPRWEQVQAKAHYAVSFNALEQFAEHMPVISAIDFTGGTEAVLAAYDNAKVLIVEFTTPQLAAAAEARINARIKELQSQNQPVPSAYKRVGNYSVFVFDAPDQETAARLLGAVNYEQVVQWLGDDPHLFERAARYYRQTTTNILLAAIKASSLAFLACAGLGIICGAIIFWRRRARQTAVAAYSDAGGMVRLNIDGLTPQASSSIRLLGRGDQSNVGN